MSARPSKSAHVLARYFPIADAVATLFKPHLEVVIHDLSTITIAYIANSFSKRHVGDTSASDRLSNEVLRKDVIGPYRKMRNDGANLRSITATLRDEEGRAIGMMCFNFDVSVLEQIGDQIASLSRLPSSLEPHAPFFHDNWRQALERRVATKEEDSGVPAATMSLESRASLIAEIEAEGLLEIRNAPSVAAKRLGISRTALYNHLRQIRAKRQGP